MRKILVLIAGVITCLSAYANDSIPKAEDYFGKANDEPEIGLPEGFDSSLRQHACRNGTLKHSPPLTRTAPAIP